MKEFAQMHKTMAEIWAFIPKIDWMFWMLDKIKMNPDDKTLRLFAVWCARNTPLEDGRKTGDLLTDPRSIAALEVSERYAYGNATSSELAAARASAEAAAWTAAKPSVMASAEATARATDSDAEIAASAASGAAARAASGTAAGAASWAAAIAAARHAQCNQFRLMVSNPFIGGAK